MTIDEMNVVGVRLKAKTFFESLCFLKFTGKRTRDEPARASTLTVELADFILEILLVGLRHLLAAHLASAAKLLDRLSVHLLMEHF